MSTPNQGPNAFFSEEPNLNLLNQVNATIPGSTPGGPIEATKRALVTALREQADHNSLLINGKRPYIDLEYPLKEENYPGIWVQFSLSKFQRAGIAQEQQYWDQPTAAWTPIQTWTYEGRATLSLVGIKNKDRDRLADGLLAMIAFSRPPEVWITQPGQDTQQYRSFLTSLNNNPFVSLTPNSDIIISGGQGTEFGVPWQPDQLAYSDTYSFDLHGQTMVQFMHDGAYTLSNVEFSPQALSAWPSDVPVASPIGNPIGAGSIGTPHSSARGRLGITYQSSM